MVSADIAPVPASREVRESVLRLLVPVDDSTGSTSALELAVWIAGQARGGTMHRSGASVELEVLHVVEVAAASGRWIDDLAGLFGFEPVLVSRKYAALMQERGKQVVDRAVARCRERGIAATGTLERGNVVESISRRAAPSDFVVVGLRGEGGDRFPGHDAGTTERIVHRAPVSIVVAPLGMHRVDGIALGYDGSEGARRALETTARLAELTRVPVHAFAVGRPDIDFADLVGELGAREVWCRTHHVEGDPRGALPAEAIRHGCNVLALGYRGRSQLKDTFLGRTTEWLLGKIDIGMLIAR